MEQRQNGQIAERQNGQDCGETEWPGCGETERAGGSSGGGGGEGGKGGGACGGEARQRAPGQTDGATGGGQDQRCGRSMVWMTFLILSYRLVKKTNLLNSLYNITGLQMCSWLIQSMKKGNVKLKVKYSLLKIVISDEIKK